MFITSITIYFPESGDSDTLLVVAPKLATDEP